MKKRPLHLDKYFFRYSRAKKIFFGQFYLALGILCLKKKIGLSDGAKRSLTCISFDIENVLVPIGQDQRYKEYLFSKSGAA